MQTFLNQSLWVLSVRLPLSGQAGQRAKPLHKQLELIVELLELFHAELDWQPCTGIASMDTQQHQLECGNRVYSSAEGVCNGLQASRLMLGTWKDLEAS